MLTGPVEWAALLRLIDFCSTRLTHASALPLLFSHEKYRIDAAVKWDVIEGVEVSPE